MQLELKVKKNINKLKIYINWKSEENYYHGYSSVELRIKKSKIIQNQSENKKKKWNKSESKGKK